MKKRRTCAHQATTKPSSAGTPACACSAATNARRSTATTNRRSTTEWDSLHPRLLLDVLRRRIVGREPYAAFQFHVLNEHFQRGDARPMTRNVRMIRQHEHRVLLPG